MRTSLLLVLGVTSLLLGCLDGPESLIVPWPAAGSEAVYTLDSQGMMVVSVRGLVLVPDAADIVREALRIDYEWRRGGLPVVASQFVDGSGRTVVVTAPMVLCADALCTDGAINQDARWDYVYEIEGSPGLLGMGPLYGSNVRLDCQEQRVRSLWAGASRNLIAMEAATVRFCGEPFPARVETASRTLELQSVRWTPGDPPRGALRYDTHLGVPFERWSTPFPASWSPAESFGLREAFDWAVANDAPFADYVARHPQAVLHGTGYHWAGMTKAVVEEQRWRRTITLQDPPGDERHRLILVKRVVETPAGSLKELMVEQSSREHVPASIARAAIPGSVVNRAAVEQWLEDRLGMAVNSATIRSYSPGPEGDHLPNGDHYEYALYFPSSEATAVSFPYEVRVNASSGRLQFLSVPQSTWFALEPGR